MDDDYEEETKNLHALLNGDHLWNNYLKKQQQYRRGRDSKVKRPNPAGKRAANLQPVNIMDVKQLMSYTKDRLNFLSSQHTAHLNTIVEEHSAVDPIVG